MGRASDRTGDDFGLDFPPADYLWGFGCELLTPIAFHSGLLSEGFRHLTPNCPSIGTGHTD